MALRVLAAADLRQNLRANAARVWGRTVEAGGSKLDAAARVYEPWFNVHMPDAEAAVSPGMSFFAMGSCFAREIEAALGRRGFTAASRPRELRLIGEQGEHGMLNRYNTASMLLEFRRLLEDRNAVPPDALRIAQSNDLFTDAHYYGMDDGTADVIQERRDRFWEDFQALRETDFIVITLGLVEAAFDPVSGLYRNVSPTPREIRRGAPTEVHMLTFQDNLDNLEAIRDLIRRHCKPSVRLFLTVSPIPLTLTYQNLDVVIANAAAKATLRAVADEFCLAHADVTYFPSYEIAMHSAPPSVWAPDRRHIQKKFVDHIVGQFCRAFLKADAPA